MVSLVDDKKSENETQPRCQFRADDVVVLLGAGASVEANLLSSMGMTKRLEANITSTDGKLKEKWGRYGKLYRAVKSAILYGSHLTAKTVTATKTEINIEELVNVLTELAKAESHTIYPFIAAWNMELVKHGGVDFNELKNFRRDIVNELVGSWVNVKNSEDCAYYRGFYNFWEETHLNLRIFSLNYDMCVERACGISNVCRGFRPEELPDGRIRKVWKDGQMDDSFAEESAVRLYKLHGSLDWRRDKDSRLLYCEDSPDPCADIDDYQLIFGTSYKLSYQDPFLYQISELRKYSAKARLIIAIGYGYNDDHINEILGKAIQQKEDVILYSVEYLDPCADKDLDERKKTIASKLKLHDSELPRINIWGKGAKPFLEEQFSRTFVEKVLFGSDEDLF
jgi:hypothetical protein